MLFHAYMDRSGIVRLAQGTTTRTGVTEVKMQGWQPSSSSYLQSYHPSMLSQSADALPQLLLELTDSETIAIDGSAPIQAQPRVKGLVDNGMAGSCEEMRELDGLSALVDHESAHRAKLCPA